MILKQAIYKKALSNLDRTIAIILLITTIVWQILSISKGHYGMLPTVILFSSTAYLIFRDKISFNDNLPEILESNRLIVFTHICFFFSVSLLLWLSWNNLYYRSPLYFIVVLIAACSTIINIFCLNNIKVFNVTIVFIKIVTLSYVIYAGIYYQFDRIYGIDPWIHNGWIQEIISTGHLPESALFSQYYSTFPIFHLNGALTSMVTNLSSYSSVFVSCGFLMAMSGVFAFIISRTMINSKAALVVALIVPLTSNNIDSSTALIPMSLGYIFILSIICSIFCSAERISKRILIIFLSIVLILTHSIAAFAMLLILIALFVGVKSYYAVMKTNASYQVFSLTFIGVFTVTMIMRWMLPVSGHTAFFDYRFTHLIYSLQFDSQFALDKPDQISNTLSNILLFNEAGYLLLLAFAVIGALIFLHFYTPNKIGLLFLTGSLFILIYSFSLLSLDNILPFRWYLFLYLPLSILAVEGLFWVSNFIKSKIGRLAIVVLIILVIIFSMSTNNLGNKDNPFFFNNAIRYGYTQSEFAAVHTLSDIEAGIFVTDTFFSKTFPYILTDDKYNQMRKSNKKVFIQRNYYLKNPEWNNKYQVSVSMGNKVIGNNVLILNFMKEKYRINNTPMIYSNGNIKVYVL